MELDAAEAGARLEAIIFELNGQTYSAKRAGGFAYFVREMQ